MKSKYYSHILKSHEDAVKALRGINYVMEKS